MVPFLANTKCPADQRAQFLRTGLTSAPCPQALVDVSFNQPVPLVPRTSTPRAAHPTGPHCCHLRPHLLPYPWHCSEGPRTLPTCHEDTVFSSSNLRLEHPYLSPGESAQRVSAPPPQHKVNGCRGESTEAVPLKWHQCSCRRWVMLLIGSWEVGCTCRF